VNTETVGVEATVTGLIGDILGFEPDEYDLSDSFTNDLDADSLAMVELAAAVEEIFGVSRLEEHLVDVGTPAQLIAFINSHPACTGPGAQGVNQ